MGLKKMLLEGVANEYEQLNKASESTTPAEEPTITEGPEETPTAEPAVEPAAEPQPMATPTPVPMATPSPKATPTKKNTGTSAPKKQEKESSTTKKKVDEDKNKGGRRPNAEKGIANRKQYTLTLKEDTYNMIVSEARKEEISFAKFMERAAIEYINNHN